MKRTAAGLFLILVLAAGLRFWGLGWGVPNSDRFTTLYVDEYTPIHALSQMSPRHLQLNPHYFINPTFFYYQMGAAYQLASMLNYLTLSTSQTYYLEHPDQYARFYLVGRFLVTLYALLTVFLFFLLGKKVCGSPWGGLLTAFFYAVVPLAVMSSHVLELAIPITFWLGLTWLLLIHAVERQSTRWLWAAAICGGLSASTKYTALPLILPIFYAVWKIRRRPTDFAIASGLFTAAFFAGSPYILIDAQGFLGSFPKVLMSIVVENKSLALSYYLAPFVHYPYSVGTVLSLLCFGALFWQGVQRRPAAILALLYVVPFLMSFMKSTLHVTRYLNETLPFLLPFGAIPICALMKSDERIKQAVGFVLLLLALSRVPYGIVSVRSLALERDPRDRASDWIKTNLPAKSLIGLETEGNFLTPAHLYMKFWEGSRYPKKVVGPPDYRITVYDKALQDWEGHAKPDYWIESHAIFSRVGRKNPIEIAQVEAIREKLAQGYKPIQTFEREMRWGPFHYERPVQSGLEWRIFYPVVTIHQRIR